MVPDPLTEPYLVICEGRKDESFLRNLSEERKINGLQFAYPTRETGGYGKQQFHSLLSALAVPLDRYQVTEGIVIVTDSDDNPATAFKYACDAIRKSTNSANYAVPDALMKTKKDGGKLRVAVATIPWVDELGNLETLILKAVPDYLKKEWDCFQPYLQCSDTPTWAIGKQSKMKMQCIIAAACKEDPSCSVGTLWEKEIWDKRPFKQMLEHKSYNPIAEFLESCPSLFS